jgi:C4-dicarboxylate transporter DctQ subunit
MSGAARPDPPAPRDLGWLGACERATAALARIGAWAGAGLMLCLGVIAGYGILTRYLFGRAQTWVDELSGFLIVLVVMLGAAEALRRGDHIAVDIVTERLGRSGRRAIEALGLVAVLAVAGVVFVSSWSDVRFGLRTGEISEGYLGVPKWIPKSSLLLGMALLGLAAVNRLLRLLLGRA